MADKNASDTRGEPACMRKKKEKNIIIKREEIGHDTRHARALQRTAKVRVAARVTVA